MDVVPYITDISTGDMDTGTKKFLRRSASGAFVASVDDTTNKSITVKGFNLKGGKVCLGTDEKATTAYEFGHWIIIIRSVIGIGTVRLMTILFLSE